MTHLTNSNQTEITARIQRVEDLLDTLKMTGPGDVLRSSGRVLKRYSLGERMPFARGLVVDMIVNYSHNSFLTEYEEQVILIVSGNGSCISVTYDSVEDAMRILGAKV